MPRSFPFGQSSTDFKRRFPRIALAIHAPSSPAVASSKIDLKSTILQLFDIEEEIDIERANQAKQRAEDRIKNKEENIDFRRAEVALKRAINRINVSSY